MRARHVFSENYRGPITWRRSNQFPQTANMYCMPVKVLRQHSHFRPLPKQQAFLDPNPIHHHHPQRATEAAYQHRHTAMQPAQTRCRQSQRDGDRD